MSVLWSEDSNYKGGDEVGLAGGDAGNGGDGICGKGRKIVSEDRVGRAGAPPLPPPPPSSSPSSSSHHQPYHQGNQLGEAANVVTAPRETGRISSSCGMWDYYGGDRLRRKSSVEGVTSAPQGQECSQ
ncbi:hypothetical protein Tco_0329212 [Tanacetum coccineum]